MKQVTLFTLLLAALFSCAPSRKPTATGRSNEIFVISSKPIYQGVIGDTLRSIFSTPVEWLNQVEPIYDLYHTPPAALNNISRRHRNMIFVNIDSTLTSTTLTNTKDNYAQNQLIFNIDSPNADSAAVYLWKARETMIELFDQAEVKRWVDVTRRSGQEDIERLVLDKFGFQMSIPLGFRVRVDKPDFLWLDTAIPLGTQGIVIYKIADPGIIDSTFFVSSRNAAINQIPGPVDGSYMSTEDLITPMTHNEDINGNQWFITQGFWTVVGDFMGGPFANYITIYDGEMIGIDFYVQYPKEGKRKYMRQLQSIPHNIILDSVFVDPNKVQEPTKE